MSKLKQDKNQRDTIELTKRWVEEIVLGLNLCPFAHKPFKDDKIKYIEINQSDSEFQFQAVCQEMIQLGMDETSPYSTALVIFSNGLEDFETYLDFVEDCQVALSELGLEGIVQIASFHPEYLFEGEENPLHAHTNRSPFPIVHLLLESEVEKAILSHPDTETIPEENKKTLERMGLEKIKSIFNIER